MSPLALRRYRADRLLREEFQGLRARVLRVVGGKLRARGMALDAGDLEGCYATAWQGLHAAMLEGEEIESVAGWLVLVTFRRAVDECRARGAAVEPEEVLDRRESSTGHDLAGELDDRIRLAQLFEGLRVSLNERERQAAALCYLQGLSRAEAAARMGISQGRMRKLMEGRGAADPGVCGKLGVLAETIESGRWCESQGSLMRALAYGVLDPEGERQRIAIAHCDGCPACRAYVLSLRGLAGALPPVLLPWGPLAGAFGGAHGAVQLSEAARHGAQSGAAGVGPTSGVAGASGAAGSGWLLTGGGVSAKLAVGCLLALGVGGGCVALDTGGTLHHGHGPRRGRSQTAHVVRARAATQTSSQTPVDAARRALAGAGLGAAATAPAERASREFGPEQAVAGGSSRMATAVEPVARVASVQPRTTGARPAGSSTSGSQAAAEREFAPG